ncbi:hypothetical protein HELRODRAFT_153133, partial [Helobdella robusta]|uniref:Bcl-2 Bcl-2 homology region 1-3 domain-containing protein n=1 Tax=Helobdella robusta TaxID=6412 RepID=T1EKZ7_HELRO
RVLKEMFSDGHTNWGRIATLFAFGAALCKYSLENNKQELIEPITDSIALYISTNKSNWIRQQNGWVGFFLF